MKKSNPGGNMTTNRVDGIYVNSVYQSYFASGFPSVVSGRWGLMVTLGDFLTADQFIVTVGGIASRHRENSAWTAWKSVAFS